MSFLQDQDRKPLEEHHHPQPKAERVEPIPNHHSQNEKPDKHNDKSKTAGSLPSFICKKKFNR
jgi:hypothetical protein